MIDFEYIKPTKLSDAKKLLGELKSNAKILAGGTDLVDQIRTKKSQPKVLIDLKSIPELQIPHCTACPPLRSHAEQRLA